MSEWILKLDLLSLILGAVLGTLVSTWHSYYIKRPKLQVTGSGGGGGTFHTNYITVTNSPGLIGFKLPETTILGRHIHSHIEKGLVVERSPARKCGAFLYDKQTKQFIKPLWWRTPDGKLTREVTIKSGESVSLMLFGRLNEETRKYFVYQPARNDGSELQVPEDEDKFETTRNFYIIIHHSYGKKKMRIDCTMTKGFDGRLQFSSQGGGGSF